SDSPSSGEGNMVDKASTHHLHIGVPGKKVDNLGDVTQTIGRSPETTTAPQALEFYTSNHTGPPHPNHRAHHILTTEST
ncbi:hypothetical protein P7K49_014916, partial [Saguinus oedipus]